MITIKFLIPLFKNMENNVVGWFEVYVADMPRAKKFYEAVFQKGEWMDLSDDNVEMFAFPWTDDGVWAAGALVKMADREPSAQGSLVYFSCEDCSVEEARVEEAGGKVLQGKMSIGQFGFIAMVMDTEGNMIWLHSNK